MPEEVGFREAFQLLGQELTAEFSYHRNGHSPEPIPEEMAPEDPEEEQWRGLDPVGSLSDYLRVVFGLEPARHHQIMIEALEDESLRRIAFVCPPGHAKTTVAGIAYSSWKIGLDPSRHFIYFGNTSTQANKQSVAVRDITQTPPYQRFFPVQRSPKGWAQGRWYLDRESVWDKDPTMLAVGIDGPVLGSRADEMIFDDVCDLENMATPEQRKKVRSKILTTAFSRQTGASKSTRMIAVMTRWHEDDLLSLFDEQGFSIIWMPARGYWEFVQPYGIMNLEEAAKLPELEKLEDGDALWPEEYPVEYFAPIAKSDPDAWLLEYQGLATRPAGNQFTDEDFRYWSNNPKNELKELAPESIRAVIQYWDTAGKAGPGNDFNCCQTWAWAADGYYLLSVFQDKMEFSNLVEAASALLRSPVTIPGLDMEFATRFAYIEETGGNNGAALVSMLQLRRQNALGIYPNMSKEARAGAALLVLRDSTKPVYFPLEESQYRGTQEAANHQLIRLTRQAFIDQHKSFPRGRHDDMVDVTAMALEDLRKYPVKLSLDAQEPSRMPPERKVARRSPSLGNAQSVRGGNRFPTSVNRGRFATGRNPAIPSGEGRYVEESQPLI
jgi:phage terminase large subunit-like protein